MDNINKALTYLNKNIYKNCDLITFIQLFPEKIRFIYNEDDGVCFIYDNSIICMSTNNKKVAVKAVKLCPKINSAICKSKHDFEILNNINKFKNVERVYQFIFQKTAPYYDDKIKELSFEYAQFIVDTYSKETTVEEIENLMKYFKFYGYFEDNVIKGYIGRHIDGEIGFIEVLPQYQRQGIATKLLKKIVNEDSNIIPFSQILISNKISIKLHKKLKAKRYRKIVYWCY